MNICKNDIHLFYDKYADNSHYYINPKTDKITINKLMHEGHEYFILNNNDALDFFNNHFNFYNIGPFSYNFYCIHLYRKKNCDEIYTIIGLDIDNIIKYYLLHKQIPNFEIFSSLVMHDSKYKNKRTKDIIIPNNNIHINDISELENNIRRSIFNTKKSQTYIDHNIIKLKSIRYNLKTKKIYLGSTHIVNGIIIKINNIISIFDVVHILLQSNMKILFISDITYHNTILLLHKNYGICKINTINEINTIPDNINITIINNYKTLFDDTNISLKQSLYQKYCCIIINHIEGLEKIYNLVDFFKIIITKLEPNNIDNINYFLSNYMKINDKIIIYNIRNYYDNINYIHLYFSPIEQFVYSNIDSKKIKLLQLFCIFSFYSNIFKDYKKYHFLYHNIQQLINSKIEKECCICFNTIANIGVTSCFHYFCTKCISEAIKQNNLCPICRKYITNKDYVIYNEQNNGTKINYILYLIRSNNYKNIFIYIGNSAHYMYLYNILNNETEYNISNQIKNMRNQNNIIINKNIDIRSLIMFDCVIFLDPFVFFEKIYLIYKLGLHFFVLIMQNTIESDIYI